MVGLALVSAFSSYQAGRAQAKAAKQQAELDSLRADEMLRRNEINNREILSNAQEFSSSQAAKLAGMGRSGATESDTGEMYKTLTTAYKQIELNNEAADWDARMIRLGAESAKSAAETMATANTIGSIAGLGMNLTTYYTNKGYQPTTKGTPKAGNVQ